MRAADAVFGPDNDKMTLGILGDIAIWNTATKVSIVEVIQSFSTG